MARNETPDIMASLMYNDAKKEEGNKAVNISGNKAIKEEIVKEIKHGAKKAIMEAPKQLYIEGTEEHTEIVQEEELKEKATFNLPVKLLVELEDKWMEIRKMSGSKQISKTLIVEEALKMAFSEFDLKREIGKFYGKLVSNIAVKQ